MRYASLRACFSAALNAIRGDYRAALLDLTRQPDGSHATTHVFGLVTVVAEGAHAASIAKRVSPWNPEGVIDKTGRLQRIMDFAGRPQGLFSAHADDGHREMRPPLSVIGASGVTQDLAQINHCANMLAQEILHSPQQPVYRIVNRYAARTAMVIFFGRNPMECAQDVDCIAHAFSDAERHVFRRFLRLEGTVTPMLADAGSPSLRELDRFIDKRLDAMQASTFDEETVLARLVKAQGGVDILSDANARAGIKEQLCQAMLAAVQSTAAGVTWVLHDLARHQHVQDRLRGEIAGAMDDAHVDFTESRNAYMEAVIEESLRLHAVIPLSLPRREKGAIGLTFVSLGAIHKDARYYPAPESFDPERMRDEEKRKRPKEAFMPFFTGVHTCPGQILYKTLAATALTHIISRLRVHVPQGTPYPKGIVEISTKPDVRAMLGVEALKPLIAPIYRAGAAGCPHAQGAAGRLKPSS